MGRSDLAGERNAHSRYSMIIVPFDTPGLTIVRDVSIMNHQSPEGHCEIDFVVSVPAENMLGREGDGFAIAGSVIEKQERIEPSSSGSLALRGRSGNLQDLHVAAVRASCS
jgi:alkylation response protein AidB-like acyl-CoA dehydrogenase